MRILPLLLGASVLIAVAQSNFALAATDGPVINKITAAKMADILRDLGHTAEFIEEGKKKTLTTSVSDTKVYVYFNQCEDDGCEGVRFSVGFDKSPKFNIAFANKWNNEHSYARANVDPSDGTLYLDYDLLVKGVTPASIEASLLVYGELLDDLDEAA